MKDEKERLPAKKRTPEIPLGLTGVLKWARSF